MEKFIVKHYTEDEHPTIKGNGFDGLVLGTDREEAERFINFVNDLIERFIKEKYGPKSTAANVTLKEVFGMLKGNESVTLYCNSFMPHPKEVRLQDYNTNKKVSFLLEGDLPAGILDSAFHKLRNEKGR